jgi:CDP-diacylglycerol--serine O-phosphatidyltransferase
MPNKVVAQIPNIFTLLNLVMGCIAITYILQPGIMVVQGDNGEYLAELPQQMYWAAICIGIAAIIDFFDGFVARLLGAASDMGKQLDSLADVVSFGVAPGLIVFQFLRMAWGNQPDGLAISDWFLLPAVLVPSAGAYRLARFNIDTSQSEGFKGIPIPAAGLLIASFPLIYWYTNYTAIQQILHSPYTWYGIITLVSWLMVSTLPMIALKFKHYHWQGNQAKYVLLIASLVLIVSLQWLSVPIIFLLYVSVSLATAKNKS